MALAVVGSLPFGEVGGAAYAQISVTALPKVWVGGYHIKCNGGTDGEINTVVTGNVGPYTVVWSNAATSTLINGLVAGTYWVTATDSLNNTASDTVVLVQPGLLTAGIGAHTFNNGTHISEHGASDGEMYSNIQGGIPPYTYLWAPGGHTGHTYKDLPAGEYYLTVTDAGGCTAQAQQTLTEPALFTATLHITERSGGVHLSCAGANDGEARAEASGGVPPYTYFWTGSPTTDSLATDLPAGPQALKVADANGVLRAIEFELTAPDRLEVDVTTNDLYPNGYHVSCHDCANATLTAQVTGGTGPFEYFWYRNQENGTAQLLNAGEPFYQVFVKDANGCPGEAMVKLRIPERDDWSVNGNSGVTAAIPPALGVEQRWLGTSDSTDLLMKANNQPMLRVGADGVVEFYGPVKMGELEEADSAFTSLARAMMVGADGTLKIGGSGGWPVAPVLDDPCLFYYGPNGEYNFVPTWVNGPGKIWTAAPCDANVGIGTSNPEHKLHVNGETFTGHLKVGTQTGDAHATFKGGQGNTGKTLEVLDNNSASALRVMNDGKVIMGQLTGVNDDARLYLGNGDHYIKSTFGQGLSLSTNGAEDALKIAEGSGRVHIGGGSYDGNLQGPDIKLSVKGQIVAKEVYVSLEYWSDFVFRPDYKMRTLQEEEQLIKQLGHLPDVPSEKEILETGVPLGQMDATLLRKVEELTLHLIDMDKRMRALEAENERLKRAVINK